MTSMKQLCGVCAIKKEMSLEKRKSLAFPLEVGEIHQCSECEIYVMYTGNGYVLNMEEDHLLARNLVIEERKKSVRKNNITQLRLF